MTGKPLLVFDADGVLFKYNDSYPHVWREAFGQELLKVANNCYHAHNEYGVEFESPAQKAKFFDTFDARFWSTMTPLPGAVEATRMLSAAGFRLICVSSMPQAFEDARLENFRALGMPIERVYATGRTTEVAGNPKLEILLQLKPDGFADDLLKNFEGVPESIHRAFIDYGNADSPNIGLGNEFPFDSKHSSALEFARYWMERERIAA